MMTNRLHTGGQAQAQTAQAERIRRRAMTVFPYPELDAEKEAQYELFPINLTRMMLHTQG